MDQYQEHCDFHYSTDAEIDAADARQRSEKNPEAAWVLTDRDVWHANPYYQGPPVPHPEDDYAWQALEAGDSIPWPKEHPTDAEYEELLNTMEGDDEDVPF